MRNRKSHALDIAALTAPTGVTDLGAMDRRSFVRTASGLLVATGVGCGGEGGPTVTGATGKVQVTITGLSAGVANGGTVVITLPGGVPITVTIPASGSAQADVNAGTYAVVYTPPAGHVL